MRNKNLNAHHNCCMKIVHSCPPLAMKLKKQNPNKKPGNLVKNIRASQS